MECPLRKGFVEFEFVRGDLVSDLKLRIEEVWGPPKSALDEELQGGHFWDANAWVICCETDDGTFVYLKDSDRIPTKPPVAKDDPCETPLFGRRDWEGLIHRRDLNHRRLDFVYARKLERSHDYAIHLVALVAITGG